MINIIRHMNYILKFLLPAFLFFTAFFSAKAQISQKITLQQAVDLSIKNSSNLKILNAKIADAVADVRGAKDHMLPDAKITGSYLRLGGADVNFKNLQNNNGSGGRPNVNRALYGIANVSMPLYVGGRIKYGIESAKYLEQAARLIAENDKEAIAYNAILAYTNIYKAQGSVLLIKQNLDASVKRDTTFSRLEQNGLLARNDLMKARLQTSNIELSLLDAENNLTIANINMAIMMGLAENTLIEIDSSFINAKQELMPFAEMEKLALQNRKDIQANSMQMKAAATGIKSAKAEAYPSIALTGGYAAVNIPKLITITNALNIGIGLQYNIASLWKTNTKLQRARSSEIQVSANEQVLNDQIRLQLNKDYQNYLLAQKKIEVNEKAILQATENYRITKNKYDNSLVSVNDLLDADVLLLQTKLNSSVSKADAALAFNKLLQTTGTLSK